MDHIRRTAQHATKLAKHHRAISTAVAKCFGKTKKAAAMGDLDPAQLNELLEAFLENHAAIGDECMDYAEHCAECADAAAEKAAADRLNKRTDLAALPPGFTKLTPKNIAIPRDGAPPVPLAKSEPALAAIAGLSGHDQHAPEASLE